MKLVNIKVGGETRLAAVRPNGAAVLNAIDKGIPDTMEAFIAAGDEALERAAQAVGSSEQEEAFVRDPLALAAPLAGFGRNIFCVGRNYREHVLEGARARGVEPVFPKVPEFFTKPRAAIVGPEGAVEAHGNLTSKLDYEVELGVVIGRRVRDASVTNALDAVFGYTIVNDISARDLQVAHGQWFKGKSLDTSCPIGPCIVTRDEFEQSSDHRLMLRVNGELRQNSLSSDMIFTIAEIIASLSSGLTLEPGDVISTGTPQGVGLGLDPQIWLKPGDMVEAEIEGIGVLRNTIVA